MLLEGLFDIFLLTVVSSWRRYRRTFESIPLALWKGFARAGVNVLWMVLPWAKIDRIRKHKLGSASKVFSFFEGHPRCGGPKAAKCLIVICVRTRAILCPLGGLLISKRNGRLSSSLDFRAVFARTLS